MPKLYDLTEYSGSRRNSQRRTVVATVETTQKGLVVTGIGAVVGLAVSGLVALLVPATGAWSFASLLVTIPLAHWAFARRRTGLQVSNLAHLDAQIGARRGRSLSDMFGRGPGRGINRVQGRIIISGMTLQRPEIVDLDSVWTLNPRHLAGHTTLPATTGRGGADAEVVVPSATRRARRSTRAMLAPR